MKIRVNDESRYLDINADVVLVPTTKLLIWGNVYIRNSRTVLNQGHIEVSGDIDGQNASSSVWTQDTDSKLEAG